MTDYLNQSQLAERWHISERTLERWRWLGRGPDFIKVGGAVRYRLSDIEAYERKRLRWSGGEPNNGKQPQPRSES